MFVEQLAWVLYKRFVVCNHVRGSYRTACPSAMYAMQLANLTMHACAADHSMRINRRNKSILTTCLTALRSALHAGTATKPCLDAPLPGTVRAASAAIFSHSALPAGTLPRQAPLGSGRQAAHSTGFSKLAA